MSRFGGVIGAALLMAVLFALVLGVYGAVYIDAFRPTPMQHAATSTTPAPVAEAPPIVPKAVAIPPVPLAQLDPAAGRNTPAPVAAAEPTYWVEYGAYRGPFYAEKLVGRLAALGIQAEITRARGAGDGRYFSVRSSTTRDRAGAQADAQRAGQLGITPLIHHGLAGAPAQPTAAKIATPQPSHRLGHYWVQFGAYDGHGYAVALRDRLRQADIDATIVERHRPGLARYLVRSAAPLEPDEARSLAAHGQSILGLPPLVGRTPLPAA
ncbi:MAG: SPOR domain-containing protein [Stellaceae bacterium]